MIVLVLVLAAPATAATITVTPPIGDTPAVVQVQGVLQSEDIEAFRFKVARLSKAVVAFESEGGSLLAGIRIGELIRMKGFVTVVAAGARCASACAIAWLGGVQRFMGEPALVGFHAAYRDDGTGPTEVGSANAILGAYLSTIGLSESAIYYVTMAAPSSMTWLTLQEAAKHGIEVRPLPNTPPSQPSSAAPASEPRHVAAETDWERQTGEFIKSLFTAWSAPTLNVAVAFGSLYADQVKYYGKDFSRADVIADKQRFIERWPQRRYVLTPGTLTVQCNGRTCAASGYADWETFNPTTAAPARGTAQYQYSVTWPGNDPQIILESSAVVARDKSLPAPAARQRQPSAAQSTQKSP
jgi:hypothetical protein